MPIIVSIIAWDMAQADGRRMVREQHTQDTGDVVVVDYLAESDTDTQAVLSARIPILTQQAIDRELAANEAEVLGGV